MSLRCRGPIETDRQLKKAGQVDEGFSDDLPFRVVRSIKDGSITAEKNMGGRDNERWRNREVETTEEYQIAGPGRPELQLSEDQVGQRLVDTGHSSRKAKVRTKRNSEMGMFEEVAQEREIAMYAQDPLFTPLDVVFLKSVGVTVIPCNKHRGTGIINGVRTGDVKSGSGCDGTPDDVREDFRNDDYAGSHETTTTLTTLKQSHGPVYLGRSEESRTLEERVKRMNLRSSGVVTLNPSPNKDDTLRSNITYDTPNMTTTTTTTSSSSSIAITTSTFLFAPFLEHNVLLEKIVGRVLHTPSRSTNTTPDHTFSHHMPHPSSTYTPTATHATALPRTTAVTSITTSSPSPGPALYIGTDIAEAADAFTRQTSQGEFHRNTKDTEFTFHVSRRQRRRQKQEERQQQRQRWMEREQEQEREREQGGQRNGKCDEQPGLQGQRLRQQEEGDVVAASRVFLASRSSIDAFPEFDLFPLAFRGLWIYWAYDGGSGGDERNSIDGKG